MRDLRIHGMVQDQRLVVTARTSTGAIVSGSVDKDPLDGDGLFRWVVEGTPSSLHGSCLLASGTEDGYLRAVEALSNAIAAL